MTLAPGETKTVRFSLGRKELQYWSASERKWVQEAETFDVWVGNDSTAANHLSFKVVQ